MLNREKGFTLIELMIVMAIIAVLAVLGIAAIQTARKTARDTQRRDLIKTYQVALEAYYTANKRYPASLDTHALFLSKLRNYDPLDEHCNEYTGLCGTLVNLINSNVNDPLDDNSRYLYYYGWEGGHPDASGNHYEIRFVPEAVSEWKANDAIEGQRWVDRWLYLETCNPDNGECEIYKSY